MEKTEFKQEMDVLIASEDYLYAAVSNPLGIKMAVYISAVFALLFLAMCFVPNQQTGMLVAEICMSVIFFAMIPFLFLCQKEQKKKNVLLTSEALYLRKIRFFISSVEKIDLLDIVNINYSGKKKDQLSLETKDKKSRRVKEFKGADELCALVKKWQKKIRQSKQLKIEN